MKIKLSDQHSQVRNSRRLEKGQRLALESPFLEAKIKQAVWVCEGSRAPGPDGFTFTFLKSHWDSTKGDIIEFVKEFEVIGRIPKGCNSTFVTLIPKCEDPLTLSDYRPISLVCVNTRELLRFSLKDLRQCFQRSYLNVSKLLLAGDRF